MRSYIVYAKRTPIGKLGGKLAPIRVDDMMALLLADYCQHVRHEAELIDDIIVGCANQAGEDNRNLARMSAILSGIPWEVPGTTINRLCASSLDAVIGAAARIGTGAADCILAGGAESMTRAPWVISKGSMPYGRDSRMYDTTFGWRFSNPKMQALFPLYSMGETAEEIARGQSFSREEQDRFALNSHQKAHAAWEGGHFDGETLAVEISLRKNQYKVERDEGIRPDSSLQKLAKLPPVFRKEGTVTAGNSSQMSDGAALVAVVSEDFLRQHKLTPLAAITGWGVRGVEPNKMGLGPIVAVRRLCRKFNKKISDFDVVELNEAFAIQAMICMKELGLDPDKVNPNGGAIALGHPLGCSGARILTTLVHSMQSNPSYRQGLATMCVGVGQGVAISLERC